MGRASRVLLFSLTEDTGSRFLISSRLWRNCSESPCSSFRVDRGRLLTTTLDREPSLLKTGTPTV